MDITNLTAEQKKKLKQRVLKWREEPFLFCKEVLGIDSHWDKQKEVLSAIAKHKKVTVRSGHDIGKSFVAADIALWFLQCFPDSIVITTAPTWRQVEKVLWGEIRSHFFRSKVPLSGNMLETELKIGPKWYAMGFSSDAQDAFQGFHAKHVLIIADEASGIPDDTLDQIDTLLANEFTRLLYIGNPVRASGRFAESFADPSFHKIHISCLESPNVMADKILYPALVTKAWCDEKKAKWGEDSSFYQARVLGNIPRESEDTLIRLDWIEDSILRWKRFDTRGENILKANPVQYGIDVARKGKNKTVHIVRAGHRVLEIRVRSGYDTMQTVGDAMELIEKWHPENVMVDDTGVGGGVTDRLVELGNENIVPVNNGEKADDEAHYVNKKSELAWRVREAFRLNALDIPENEDLAFECNHQYYDHTSEQKLRVMSKTMLKKLVKKLTGKKQDEFDSPDHFDALCLTYEKSYPTMVSKKQLSHLEEFHDATHIFEMAGKDLEIGVSRFNVLVTVPEESAAYLVWAAADRKGLIYFYDEALVERATSSNVADKINEVEARQLRHTDCRYSERLYFSKEDLTSRYNLAEQLLDYDYDFEDLEFNPELARINLREGLKFDKTKPVNNTNHPWVFFHPKCVNAIRAVKYGSLLKSMKNNPQMEAVYKAVGLMILSEPIWLAVYRSDNV
jgi:hypothetical protein